MTVPDHAFFWCNDRVDHVRNHFSVRYLGDAKVKERKILMQAT